MTSANDEAYGGQYPCDGWVDNVEPTLLQGNYYLLSDSGTQSKETINEIPTRQKVSYFTLKIVLVIYFPNALLT